VVGSLERLPLFPKCYQNLSQAMLRKDLTPADIISIVEQDPALSVMVLSLANAGHLGEADASISLSGAVGRVGSKLLRAMALSTDMFTRVDAELLQSRFLAELPQATLQRARLARALVSDTTLAEEAFAVALLTDIGHLVLAQSNGESYLELLQEAMSSRRPVHELEQVQLGFTHAEVSSYLIGIWGLPDRIVELVAAHHAAALLESSDNPVALAVHVADTLVYAYRTGHPDPLASVSAPIRERPELKARLADWRALIGEQ
jgi:HD-like signal output (HDOD) protein